MEEILVLDNNEKISIYYDYQGLLFGRYTGGAKYFCELVNSIQRNGYADVKVDCIGSQNEYVSALLSKDANKDNITSGISGFINRKKLIFKNKINAIKSLKSGYDIICPTNYDSYFIPWKKKSILVVTIYDMILELFPEYYNHSLFSKIRYRINTNKRRKMINKADKIIAISNNTKLDLLSYYPNVDSSKVIVFPIGTNMGTISKNECDIDLPNEYILYVGGRSGYKNFDRFSVAINMLLEKYKTLHLLCTGTPLDNEELKIFKENASRVISYSANEYELAYLYSNAICFVYPSLYEGFGIPTIEAFSCECPVILSDTSCMKEVGGDAACYFNPTDVNDMANVIEKVYLSDSLRTKMKEKGKECSKCFYWDDISKSIVDLYKSLI